MISFLVRYILIIAAIAAMLAGMQLPSLADQYEKRVDASLREVTLNLEPFQKIADLHAGGNLEELIKLHRGSAIPTFKEEGDAIEKLYKRRQYLQALSMGLQTDLATKLWRIWMFGDPDLREQTLLQFTPTVPLTQEALIAGGVVAVVVLVILEIVMALLGMFFGWIGRLLLGLWRNRKAAA
jgi:hypothetical protein